MSVTLNKISDQGTRVSHRYFGEGTTLHAEGIHRTKITVAFDRTPNAPQRPITVMNWEITPLATDNPTCDHGTPANHPTSCYVCDILSN